MSKLKKLMSEKWNIFLILLLCISLLPTCIIPLLYTHDKYSILSERRLKYHIFEDITTLNIKSVTDDSVDSYYYVEDTDGYISKLDCSVLHGDSDVYYTSGAYVVVGRRRFYTKDSGLEELRQYQNQTNRQWSDSEYVKLIN